MIRRFAQHEWRTYRDLRLHALADSPDAFGSTFAREQDRPDADWMHRLGEGAASETDLPLLVEVGGRPAGLAWCRIEESKPDVANLYQVWVAPEYRNLGAGTMLLEAVIAWARYRRIACIELGVTVGDNPAMRMYTRAGFVPSGPPQPLRPRSELMSQPMRLMLK